MPPLSLVLRSFGLPFLSSPEPTPESRCSQGLPVSAAGQPACTSGSEPTSPQPDTPQIYLYCLYLLQMALFPAPHFPTVRTHLSSFSLPFWALFDIAHCCSLAESPIPTSFLFCLLLTPELKADLWQLTCKLGQVIWSPSNVDSSCARWGEFHVSCGD